MMTVVWVIVGAKFLTVAVIFGGITAVVCGTGYIYYGKDIVAILSKSNGRNKSYRNLSTKIIVFTVVFVLFVYTFVFLYVANILGTSLSEFMLQVALGVAFILIYSVLFFRKIKRSTLDSDSGGKETGKDSSSPHTSKSTVTVVQI